MSLINFLNPKLKPTVECETICEDGYEISNLIADDAEQLARGFLPFPVTKPPVEIIFDFPKAIDLKVIKLWNSNGALRSTSFEVHGKYEGIWERVAYVRDLDKGVDAVTFCYQSDYNSRSNSGNSASQQKSEKVFFFKTAHKILANTNSLKIIIRKSQKCPPVLRKIEVWGLPARSLEKADRELVKTIWKEIINPYDERKQQEKEQRSPSRCVPELSEHSGLKIPEEFLDAITWELMIFPTVLPSGKIVDQSTIDKHSEVEAKWGRMPSDPFTGLEFTSHRKAILNLSLKARIEKFLMENSEHFKTVPRCLGSSRVRRSKNRHASQFASLSHSLNEPAGAHSSLSATYCKTKYSAAFPTESESLSTLASPAKRAKLCISSAYRSKEPIFISTSTQTSVTATASFASSLTSLTTLSSTSGTSIEKAIEQALKKITRYTHSAAETKLASCISCKSEQFAYEIQTCKHLVCRECLIKLMEDHLCTCKTSFSSADVERYHKF